MRNEQGNTSNELLLVNKSVKCLLLFLINFKTFYNKALSTDSGISIE